MPKQEKASELSAEEELLERLDKEHRSTKVSPVEILRTIAGFRDDNVFRVYALFVADELLSARKQSKLDKVFRKPRRIDLTLNKDEWVQNTRALTENAVQAQLVEFMVDQVHAGLGDGELAEEVWSILKDPWNKLMTPYMPPMMGPVIGGVPPGPMGPHVGRRRRKP